MMKILILICALSLVLAEEGFDVQDCLEIPYGLGQCLPGSNTYHYDYKSESCESPGFDCEKYSNKNHFESVEDCKNKCRNSPKFDTANCLRDSDPGMCRMNIPMYYYDFKDRSCKEFTYGGCDGNENRFVTEELCMKLCGDVYVFQS